jgi:DNA replication initiation complex subunit (GINS family)
MPDSLTKSQIRNIMRAEHKSSGITKINPGLYRALNRYLEELHQAYLEAHAENKTQKALTLTKEIRDTERDISTIYELRERKILLMAQDIVRGGAPSLKHLFPEEKLLLLRLSSILLAMRKDIRIDFHHRVDNYIRTIAKEYDLERKLFTPFRPSDPFCEDLTALQDEPSGAAAAPVGSDHDEDTADLPAVSPLPPSHDVRDEGEVTEPSGVETDTASGGDRGEMGGSDVVMDGTDGMDSGKSEMEGTGSEQVDLSPKLTEVEKEGEAAAGSGTNPSNGEKADAGGSGVGEEEDEDEPEAVDFLRENSVVGTLDSIPQFRGSDLHDYRFETGEIVTLPTKMAEILEKQGKLFIIDVDDK